MPEVEKGVPIKLRLQRIQDKHGPEVSRKAELSLKRGDFHAKTLTLLAMTSNPAQVRRILGE